MSNFSYRTPPLDAIRGFVAVTRRMSITLAAQDLCLTQSAVSRQIQALEEHPGSPLFIRRHRALELTEMGEELFSFSSPWLDRLMRFSDAARGDGRPRPVTVTANIGVTSLWILPRLGAFFAQHPNVDVRVAANNRVQDLQQDGIDLAIRYCREADAPEGAIRLFGEQIVPIANKTVAARAFKSQEGLFNEVLLELDQRARPWLRWADWLHAMGSSESKPRAFAHFNQYDQVIQAAIGGHGVALGRLALVLPMLEDGRLVAQKTSLGISDFAYWLIMSAAPIRREVQIFSDWIMSEVGITTAKIADVRKVKDAGSPTVK